MKRTTPRKSIWAYSAAIGLIAGSSAMALNVTAAAAADPATTFTYTGSAQRYQVPADVCSVTIDAFGAQGGTGSPAIEDEQDGPAGPIAAAPQAAALFTPVPGGLGGEATATITVTPGEVLAVNVGGQGGAGTTTPPGDSSHTGGEGGAAGWNGGGTGGDGAWGGGGGGGGGASDVRQGGTDLTNRVVVAGGGGGTGGMSGDPYYDPQPVGGVGGNPATKGTDGNAHEEATNAIGGGPGTATAGGTGGSGSIVTDPDVTYPVFSGTDGVSGLGGNGGSQTYNPEDELSDFAGGGGGGGGLFGGGGGGAGWYPGAGGGGGSSLGTTSAAGARSGDGEVTITALSGTCDTPPAPTSTTVATSPAVAAKPATAVPATPTYTG